ncbi:MAG: hypothetical protein FJZ62_01605 [Chlamydiae bacterium]|nr:hypothetical protein [Chlamydiota bacterium]
MHPVDSFCKSPHLFIENIDFEEPTTPKTLSPTSAVFVPNEDRSTVNFIENLHQMSVRQVHEFLQYNYKPFFMHSKTEKLEELFLREEMQLGLENLFWNKPWALFTFLDLFPKWDFQMFKCNYDGCIHRAFNENPFRFRHYLDRPIIAQFLFQKSDFEKLSFYTNCRGFWHHFPKELSSPLIEVFKKFDENFLKKGDLVEVMEMFFPLIHPRAQKSFLSINSLFKLLLTHFRCDSERLASFFRADIFNNPLEQKLFFFSFHKEEVQRQIIAEILLQKGEMGQPSTEQSWAFRSLDRVPHNFFPHHLLHFSMNTPYYNSLRLVQQQALDDIKRHTMKIVKEISKEPEKIDLLDLDHEFFLSEQGLANIDTSFDLKSSLMRLPFGQFVFVVKYNPEFRSLFHQDMGLHHSVCEILTSDEEVIFQHHSKHLQNLVGSLS